MFKVGLLFTQELMRTNKLNANWPFTTPQIHNIAIPQFKPSPGKPKLGQYRHYITFPSKGIHSPDSLFKTPHAMTH